MNKYQNGKIYKIVCDETNLTYYGSTRQKYICSRLAEHKCKKRKNRKSGIDGMTNPKIYLVEKFPCETKEELEKRERFFIENNDCINRKIPTRTKKEYYQNNKGKIIQQEREYREKNKERITQRKREYMRKYRQKIKESLQSQSV